MPDDRPAIEARSSKAAAATHALVVTTGGTGLTPRDVTPQATLAVIDYEVPGLAEAMRAAGRALTPMADLSRGVVGVRGGSLIVNLPGSPKAALESLEAIVPVAGPRPRDARRAVRPHRPGAGATAAGRWRPGGRSARRSRARRARMTFPVFADVPAYPLVFPLFWGAAVIFVLAMARHLRVFAATTPATVQPGPFANIPARFGGLIEYAFVQTKMFKDWRAALMHAGIFWGFVLLTIGTANIVTGGLIQTVLSWPLDGAIWAAISAMQNIVAVIVLVSIAWAF